MQWRKCLAIVVAALTVFGPAQAGSYKAEYKAYNAALDAGDLAEAIKHAEAAWRAAEEELGDNETTAILAYNFANAVYFSEPDRAIEPLKRVIALAGSQDEMFGADQPELMLALSAYRSEPTSKDKRTKLHSVLKQSEETKRKPALLPARAWTVLATDYINFSRFARAEKYSNFAISNYETVSDKSPEEFAQALIIAGVTRTAKATKTSDIAEALYFFDRAIDLFPPQKDIETYHPLLATALAWHATAYSVAASNRRINIKSVHDLADEKLGVEAGIPTWETPRPNDCTFSSVSRDVPKFPDQAARDYEVGAVLLGYHLDNDGKPEGLRILGEVPYASDFGKAALKAASTWQLNLAEPTRPECQRNLTTSIPYTFK